jgi:hypothetical protein
LVDSPCPAHYDIVRTCAEVAQPVEQRTENPCVGGSIPPLGTMKLQESRLVVNNGKAGFGFPDDKCGTLAGLSITHSVRNRDKIRWFYL